MEEEHPDVYKNPLGKVRVAFSQTVRNSEAAKRATALREILSLMKKGFEDAGLAVSISIVGSTATKDAGPGSDVDLIISPEDNSRDGRWKFHYYLGKIVDELVQTGKLPYHLDTLDSDVVVPY